MKNWMFNTITNDKQEKQEKPKLDNSCFTPSQVDAIEKYVNEIISYKIKHLNTLYEKEIRYK